MNYTQDYWNDVERVINNIPNKELLFGKKVLITGATGMVCSSVVEILAYLNKTWDAKIEIILLGRSEERIKDRFMQFLPKKEYFFLKFDATKNTEINTAADYIVYGSSNANPAAYSKEPVETLLTNIVGLNVILNVAKDNPHCRFLYISSSEVYGNRMNSGKELYKEEDYGYVDILNPRACYPNGKRAAETLCACFAQEYNVDTVIARPGHIYGPTITKTDSRASASFTRDALSGKDIVMKSAGEQLRSYCYTLDCASALLTVLLNGESGEAYNISNKNSVVSIRDIAEAFALAGGCKVVFQNPSDAEMKSYNMMNNSALNSSKLEKLGWKAEFDVTSGTERTLQFV